MNTHPNAEIPQGALSPHLRQRVAFIAAMIPDPDCANWPAISDTLADLSQEAHDDAFETSLESLREPIRQKDARALVATIGALLHEGQDESQEQ